MIEKYFNVGKCTILPPLSLTRLNLRSQERIFSMTKLFLSLRRFILILVITVIFFGCFSGNAFAHRPHDDVAHIELSPNYQQDKTVFIVVRSNLFKSVNGGENWQRITRGISSPTGITSFDMSAQDKNILFLSTYDHGIFKSEDGGNVWQSASTGLETRGVGLVAISNNDPSLVLASGLEGGLYKTDNGGQVWKLVLDQKIKITAIAFSPTQVNEIMIGDAQGNLYRSNNRGDSWDKIGTLGNSGVIAALAFSQEGSLYIGTEKQGIYKTSDRGKTFTAINKGLADKNIKDIVVVNPDLIILSTWDKGLFISKDSGKNWQYSSQGLTTDHQADQLNEPNFSDVEVSPAFTQDKTIFLAGFNGLFKTTNGGKNWQELESLSTGTITSLDISPNYQKDSTLAFVTYVGNIYLSRDAGKTWEAINTGLEVPRLTGNFEKPDQDPRRFFDIAFSPNYQQDNNIFATLLWDNFLKTSDQGQHWQIVTLPNVPGQGLRGMRIVPSPNFEDDKIIYLGTQYGLIMRSTDGGNTFFAISTLDNKQRNEAISLVISPDFATDETLYATTKDGVHKSIDRGSTWQALTANTPLDQLSYTQLVISPNFKQDRTLIVGTNLGFYLTNDGGDTWTKIRNASFNENGYVEGLDISPNYQNDQTFVVSLRGEGLFKTIDGGTTFSQLENGSIPLARMNELPSAGRPIQFSPNYAIDNTLYGFGSSTTEIYKSTDGGKTWETLKITRVSLEREYAPLTWIDLIIHVYRRNILRIGVAIIVALWSYFTLGFLGLEKRLPLSRLQIKLIGSILVFIVTLLIFPF